MGFRHPLCSGGLEEPLWVWIASILSCTWPPPHWNPGPTPPSTSCGNQKSLGDCAVRGRTNMESMLPGSSWYQVRGQRSSDRTGGPARGPGWYQTENRRKRVIVWKPQDNLTLFPVISDKSSLSSVFMRGLIQGVVYGAIASSLLFFFLVVLMWVSELKFNTKPTPEPTTCTYSLFVKLYLFFHLCVCAHTHAHTCAHTCAIHDVWVEVRGQCLGVGPFASPRRSVWVADSFIHGAISLDVWCSFPSSHFLPVWFLLKQTHC